jgi:hypothetical protein
MTLVRGVMASANLATTSASDFGGVSSLIHQVLERLARVARDGHLVGVAAEVGRQLASNAFDAGFQHAPHVVHRKLIREPQVPNHLVEHVSWGRTATTVVEIDHRAVHVERTLDRCPVRFVLGHARRGSRANQRVRLGQSTNRAGVERGQRHCGGAGS